MRVIYIFYGALQLYKSRIIIHAAYCNAGVIQRRGCIVSAFCNFALAPPPPLTFDKLHTIVLCIGYISSMCRIAGLLRRRARSKRGRRSDSTQHGLEKKERECVCACALCVCTSQKEDFNSRCLSVGDVWSRTRSSRLSLVVLRF